MNTRKQQLQLAIQIAEVNWKIRGGAAVLIFGYTLGGCPAFFAVLGATFGVTMLREFVLKPWLTSLEHAALPSSAPGVHKTDVQAQAQPVPSLDESDEEASKTDVITEILRVDPRGAEDGEDLRAETERLGASRFSLPGEDDERA